MWNRNTGLKLFELCTLHGLVFPAKIRFPHEKRQGPWPQSQAEDSCSSRRQCSSYFGLSLYFSSSSENKQSICMDFTPPSLFYPICSNFAATVPCRRFLSSVGFHFPLQPRAQSSSRKSSASKTIRKGSKPVGGAWDQDGAENYRYESSRQCRVI